MNNAFTTLMNKKKTKQQPEEHPITDESTTDSSDDEMVYEVLERNSAFETLKIRRKRDEKFFIATIFSCVKVDEKSFEVLENLLKMHSPYADAMILDISTIETVSPNIIKKNTKLFKNIDKISNMKRVGIIIPARHKSIKIAFDAIITMIKPKHGETKVFDDESKAIEYALGAC